MSNIFVPDYYRFAKDLLTPQPMFLTNPFDLSYQSIENTGTIKSIASEMQDDYEFELYSPIRSGCSPRIYQEDFFPNMVDEYIIQDPTDFIGDLKQIPNRIIQNEPENIFFPDDMPNQLKSLEDINLSTTNSTNKTVSFDSVGSFKLNPNKIDKKSKKITKEKKSRSIRSSEKLKNITKNFAKNCAGFAISKIGAIFLAQLISDDEVERFYNFIKSNIPSLTNIANFRRMLLPSKIDGEQIVRFKKAFQNLSIIFIRDYSYNWIFSSSRIHDVNGHILARPKMLRRVKDPKHFTNIH